MSLGRLLSAVGLLGCGASDTPAGTAMNACICVILAAIISQNAVSMKDGRSSPITVKIRIGLPADARLAWPGTE
jgi:hypothetical protein